MPCGHLRPDLTRVACPTGTSGPYWPEGDLGAPSPAARLRLPHGGGAGSRPHDTVATGDPEDGNAQECMGGGSEGDKFWHASFCPGGTRKGLGLFRQRFVDACPALGAFGMKACDRGIDLAACGLVHAVELVGRRDDDDVATVRVMRICSACAMSMSYRKWFLASEAEKDCMVT
jgi:hypothetical protein